jgi:hypothetical protein
MPQLEELRKEEEVLHRTRTHIHPQRALISVDESYRKIMIKQPDVEPPLVSTVDVGEIDFIKRRDFTDVDRSDHSVEMHLLSLNHKDGNHTSFQFGMAAKRDAWETGLRTMISGAMAGSRIGEVKVPAQQYMAIKSLTTEICGEDELLRLTVSLGKREGVLSVKKTENTAKDWKRITDEFVEKNAVLPTEATSLYRYIRSVIDRTLMEKEAVAVIEEINEQSFEKLVKKKHGSSASDDEIVRMAADRLTTISSQLATRIGSHGNGGMVICQILHRNIEKMKLINEMAVKVTRAEGGGASDAPGNAGTELAAR